jgi:hypothetical protein
VLVRREIGCTRKLVSKLLGFVDKYGKVLRADPQVLSGIAHVQQRHFVLFSFTVDALRLIFYHRVFSFRFAFYVPARFF